MRFWIPFRRQRDYTRARSDAIIRIKKAFDENDITIPFPIRTLDFGAVGGVPRLGGAGGLAALQPRVTRPEAGRTAET